MQALRAPRRTPAARPAAARSFGRVVDDFLGVTQRLLPLALDLLEDAPGLLFAVAGDLSRGFLQLAGHILRHALRLVLVHLVLSFASAEAAGGVLGLTTTRCAKAELGDDRNAPAARWEMSHVPHT